MMRDDGKDERPRDGADTGADGEGKADGDHLDPDTLGAFLDGALRTAELSRVEAHLAACAQCRQEAIQVGRLTESDAGNGKRRRRLAYWAVPTAAAAGIAALLLFGPRAQDVAGPETPILRTDDAGARAIEVVSPASSGTSADSVVFAWRQVESGVVYSLTLMDDEGEVLWKETVEDTAVTLPAQVELRPGDRYYWHVDALLALARTATSGVQELTISH